MTSKILITVGTCKQNAAKRIAVCPAKNASCLRRRVLALSESEENDTTAKDVLILRYTENASTGGIMWNWIPSSSRARKQQQVTPTVMDCPMYTARLNAEGHYGLDPLIFETPVTSSFEIAASNPLLASAIRGCWLSSK